MLNSRREEKAIWEQTSKDVFITLDYAYDVTSFFRACLDFLKMIYSNLES